MKRIKKDLFCRLDGRPIVIPFVKKSPWIDGQLNDDCWKHAVALNGFKDITACMEHVHEASRNTPAGFRPEPGIGPARPRTELLLCHDKRHLYAGFVCHDDHIEQLRKRDHGYSTNVNREDCVYLWLDPQFHRLQASACEYIVNAAGQKSEYLHGNYSGSYESIMAWDGRVSVHKKMWVAEIVIPLKRLGVNLRDNMAFGFNAGRGYRGDCQTHALMKPDRDFMPGFGYAVLSGGKAKIRDRGLAMIRQKLEQTEKLKKGLTLWSYPGSCINIAPHRDDNDMVGITAWGPDHQPTISVGRSDSYDRRWYGNEGRAVTRKEVIAAAMSGDASRLAALRRRACAEQYGAYSHFPCPKPVGQIIFMLPGGAGLAWRTEVTKDEDNAVKLVCRCRKGTVRLRIYVHKKRNLVVAEGEQNGFTGEVFKLRLYRHRDNPHNLRPMKGYDYYADEKAGKNVGPLPPPQTGRTGNMLWVRQPFFPDLTFPKGFEVLLAAQVYGAEVKKVELHHNKTGLGTPAVSPYEGWETKPDAHLACQATHFRHLDATPGYAGTFQVKMNGSKFRALFPVVSTNDGRDTVRKVSEILRAASAASPEALESESKNTLPLKDGIRYQSQQQLGVPQIKQFDTTPSGGIRYQYQQQLGGLCGVFDGKFVFDDITYWHADYHFNELFWHPHFITGNLEKFELYFQMVEANLPAARRLAREAFSCRGAMFSLATFPMKFKRLPMTALDWDYNIECTGLVIQPFWLMYLYTMDREFLARRAYPVIKEAASFYADYVTLEKDGKYHIWPCTSGEHVTLQPYLEYNRDSQAALSMAKFILKAAVEGARVLKRDQALAQKWQKIIDRLAPYPTEMTPEGPRLVDVAGARLMTEYNQAGPLAAVIFGDDIGLASPPREREIALRARKGIVRYSTAYHWNHIYRAMKFLGVDPGSPITCENLIQSHQGPIFLFPAVPDGYTGEFNDHRARGAFRVSAAIKKGRVTMARIKSLAGETCCVDLSRFKRIPTVRCLETRAGVKAVNDSDRFLVFATIPGNTYELQMNQLQKSVQNPPRPSATPPQEGNLRG